jgi:hypothetical protein
VNEVSVPYRLELDSIDKCLVNSKALKFLEYNYEMTGIGYEINEGEITHVVIESEVTNG